MVFLSLSVVGLLTCWLPGLLRSCLILLCQKSLISVCLVWCHCYKTRQHSLKMWVLSVLFKPKPDKVHTLRVWSHVTYHRCMDTLRTCSVRGFRINRTNRCLLMKRLTRPRATHLCQSSSIELETSMFLVVYGLSLCSTSLLHPSRIIEQAFKTRRVLAKSLAEQYFTCYLSWESWYEDGLWLMSDLGMEF